MPETCRMTKSMIGLKSFVSFQRVQKRFQVELEDEVCDLCSEQFEEICVDSEKGECHGGSHEMSSKWEKMCPETLVPISMHIDLF